MKQQLFQVSIKDRHSGETLRLRVWAANVDEATHSINRVLIGPYCEYRWTGSSPVYANNNVVTREIDPRELR